MEGGVVTLQWAGAGDMWMVLVPSTSIAGTEGGSMDKIDFEAYIGLPITEEQFDAFELLYKSGCFEYWADFARKAQLIVNCLYLPGTKCCLRNERRRWVAVCEFHPDRYVRQEAREIYMFLRDLKMWYTEKDIIFRIEYVKDHILHILQDVDGAYVQHYDGYPIYVELDIPTLAAFCEKLLDTICHATGRLWKDEMEEVDNGEEN